MKLPDWKKLTFTDVIVIGLVILLIIVVYSIVSDAAGSKARQANGAQLPAFTSKVSPQCDPRRQTPFDGKVLYDCAFDALMQSDLSLLDTGRRQTFSDQWQHRFDQSDALKSEEGTYKAIAAMVLDLGEMHTAFLPPKALKAIMEEINSEIGGIGLPLIRLGQQSLRHSLGENPSAEARKQAALITAETPLVVYPQPIVGTPAESAGIKAGDIIVAVNGKPSLGRTADDVINDIRGNAGEAVELLVHRPAGDSFTELPVHLVRANIRTPQVQTSEPAAGYAVIKIRHFSRDTAPEFVDALYKACTGKDLPTDNAGLKAVMSSYNADRDCRLKGLVYDLRDNPGGLMNAALDMAQAIVDEGAIITTMERKGDSIIERHDLVDEKHAIHKIYINGQLVKENQDVRVLRFLPKGLPQVAMVNHNSASASEIFTAILQAEHIATVVGEPSFGKEVGQANRPLPFGTAIKITTFRFKPADQELGSGVIPDFPAAASDLFLDNPFVGSDLQLKKAIEVVMLGRAALETAESVQAREDKEQLARQTGIEHRARDAARWAILKEQGAAGAAETPASP